MTSNWEIHKKNIIISEKTLFMIHKSKKIPEKIDS